MAKKTKAAVKPEGRLSWSTVKRKIDDLVPFPENPRQMTRKQVEDLKKSLERFDLVEIPAVSQEGVILAGHQRLKIMQMLGRGSEVIDVRIPSRKLTPAEMREYVVRSNKNTGSWSDETLSGWNRDELVQWGFTDDELDGIDPKDKEPQDAPVDLNSAGELAKKWKVELGQLWRLGKHLLICGDCTDPAVLGRLLQGEKPHLCCTDAPYGVSYDADWRNQALGKASGSGSTGKVLNDDRASWSAVFSRMPCDVVYAWHGALHTAAVARSLEVAGFELKAHIIWVKTQFVMCRSRYHWRHESCYFAVRKGKEDHWQGSRKQSTVWADIVDNFKPTDELFAGKVTEDMLAVFPGDMTTVWELGRDKAVKGGHSTQKPQEAMARCVRNSSKPGDLVFEPFCGSGTTLIACQNEGRVCRAAELSPGYVASCCQRYVDAGFGQPEVVNG